MNALPPQAESLPPFRRILILTQYYAPEPGAPSIRLQAMARELSRLGCEVCVLTGMPNYPTGKIHPGYRRRIAMRETIEGIPVRRVWLFPATGRKPLRRLLNYLSFTATSAGMLVAERRADLVFVEAQPITLALPALVNRVLRGTPYVYNTPDLQVEYAEESRWIGIRAVVSAARYLEGVLMRRALAVTTVTHAFIDHFHRERHVPRGRLTFLPNGADTERLKPMPRDRTLAVRLGVADRTVFTFAGTHAPYQGLEVILEAARLLRSRPDIVFLMVGQGPVRDQLVRRAAADGIDNVLFRDSPFDEMPKLMSLTCASLVVLRRMEIATKMRLSKAIPPMACGVPVIYAGWGETAGIIEGERVGLRVEPEDPEALARAVEYLADHPEVRDELGRRARRLAERDFSWSSLVADWMRQVGRVAQHLDPQVPPPASASTEETPHDTDPPASSGSSRTYAAGAP